MPRGWIEHPTPASSKGYLDYLIPALIFCKIRMRGRALMQDYCWDSPASLYTFRGTSALLGLDRDCSNYRSFPEFTQFFNLYFYRKPRRFRAALYQWATAAWVKLYTKTCFDANQILRDICKVEENRITTSIRIYEHMNEEELLKFWHKITNVSLKKFQKTYYGVSKSSQHKRPFNRLQYGTLAIRVNDTNLFHKIMGWIEGLALK